MKKECIGVILCALLITAAVGIMCAKIDCVYAEDLQLQPFLEEYTPMVEDALEHFNDEDYEAFYENFVSRRHAKTKRTFQFIWIDGYKDKFGNYVSRELLEEKSVGTGPYPLLVYKAIFTDHDDVTIKISFAKENGGYKIISMRFDYLPGE